MARLSAAPGHCRAARPLEDGGRVPSLWVCCRAGWGPAAGPGGAAHCSCHPLGVHVLRHLLGEPEESSLRAKSSPAGAVNSHARLPLGALGGRCPSTGPFFVLGHSQEGDRARPVRVAGGSVIRAVCPRRTGAPIDWEDGRGASWRKGHLELGLEGSSGQSLGDSLLSGTSGFWGAARTQRGGDGSAPRGAGTLQGGPGDRGTRSAPSLGADAGAAGAGPARRCWQRQVDSPYVRWAPGPAGAPGCPGRPAEGGAAGRPDSQRLLSSQHFLPFGLPS